MDATFKDGTKDRGWVENFKPTQENPNVIGYISKKCDSQGRPIESIKILDSKTKKGGKKWSGVFRSKKSLSLNCS